MLWVSDDLKQDRERIAFLQDRQIRLVGGRERHKSKRPVKAKDGDKNLRYSECSPEIQKDYASQGQTNGVNGKSSAQE